MNPKNTQQNLLIALFASLTLGLAPFAPEPHILGKIKWLLGGGKGMKPEDYFDTLLHGLPWVFLIFFSFPVYHSKKQIQWIFKPFLNQTT